MKKHCIVVVVIVQLYNGIYKKKLRHISFKVIVILYIIYYCHRMKKDYIVAVMIIQLYNGIWKIILKYINLKDMIILYGM